MELKIWEYDPTLLPYRSDLEDRMRRYRKKRQELVGGNSC